VVALASPEEAGAELVTHVFGRARATGLEVVLTAFLGRDGRQKPLLGDVGEARAEFPRELGELGRADTTRLEVLAPLATALLEPRDEVAVEADADRDTAFEERDAQLREAAEHAAEEQRLRQHLAGGRELTGGEERVRRRHMIGEACAGEVRGER